MSAIKNHFHDEICASDEPDFPEPNCLRCMDRGEVGGAVGQTPETFEWVTESCPDCSPTTANSVGIRTADELKPSQQDVQAGKG